MSVLTRRFARVKTRDTASIAVALGQVPLIVLGCWLVLAPVVLQYEPLHIGVRSSLLGILVAGLSWLAGPRTHELGGGWKRLWTSASA